MPTASAHAGLGERGAGSGRDEQVLGGQGGTAGPRPQRAEAGNAAKRLQTRRLQAVTGQVPGRETIMRWYRHGGMDLPEVYMRCQCGRELETYEHFMRCEQYRGMEGPLVRDQDIPLLKKR